MTQIHLWPEEISEQAGYIKMGFTLEKMDHERIPVWYRLPSEYTHSITKGCEPFVIASLFTTMRTPADLIVHGEVSPVLLRNLEEFQAAWSLWYPNLYNRIDIFADCEREQPKPHTTAAIASFSGGVDSCFTVWRHRKGKAGRRNQELRAGLIIHGVDIPLGRKATFDRATGRARILLESLGLELIPMVVNLKKLGDNFAHSHGAILDSCLMLLQGGFNTGLIAGSHSYADLYFPWGSNQITDQFLSSGVFNIIHDSTDIPRNRKILEIANWPEAQQYLRVCLGDDRSLRDENCCRCEKCVRTILSFRALGFGLPVCFKRDVTNRDILRLKLTRTGPILYYKAILEDARNIQDSKSWVNALRFALIINKLKLATINTSLIRRLRNIRKHLLL